MEQLLQVNSLFFEAIQMPKFQVALRAIVAECITTKTISAHTEITKERGKVKIRFFTPDAGMIDRYLGSVVYPAVSVAGQSEMGSYLEKIYPEFSWEIFPDKFDQKTERIPTYWKLREKIIQLSMKLYVMIMKAVGFEFEEELAEKFPSIQATHYHEKNQEWSSGMKNLTTLQGQQTQKDRSIHLKFKGNKKGHIPRFEEIKRVKNKDYVTSNFRSLGSIWR